MLSCNFSSICLRLNEERNELKAEESWLSLIDFFMQDGSAFQDCIPLGFC